MADCSYARCLQERRSIKRELQRWTKNMVYVVGLERVAEELMGRRKWKLYQDVLLARDLPLHQSEENDTTQDQSAAETQDSNPPENNGSEREERQPMIATAEALQRNNSATDLTQDTTQDKEEKEVDNKQLDASSPIPVDEDSKDATKEVQSTTIEEPTGQKEESNCTNVNNQPTTLKIKTIEEINTVGNDTKKPNNSNITSTTTTNTTETILESLIKRTSTGPPRPKPLPTDWKPQDKCYFCVDGELVRPGGEQTSAAPEPPASPPTVGVESGSESGSSRSSPRVGQSRGAIPNLVPSLQNQPIHPLSNIHANLLQAQAFAHLLQLQQQARAQPTANQVQSMAASLATLGALPGLNPALALCSPAFMPPWYLHQQRQQQQQQQQQQERQTQEEHASPSPRSPVPSAELPLDLSAKPMLGPGTSNSSGSIISPPSPSSLEARLRGTPIDKQLFNRTKPRLAPTPGRRAYSEDDLQMALRDIQSGRLGTRRAAVIYNIPRSTLRNKVYKMEKERGARLPEQLSGAAHRVDDSNDNGEEIDDDKDSANEDDREEEREPQRPLLSMDDILRYSQMENPAFGGQSEHLRALLRKGQKFYDMSSPKQETVPETWPLPEQATMNTYIQQMLLANALGAQLPKPEESTPAPLDIMRIFSEFPNSDDQNKILKETLLKRSHLNNGKQNEASEDELALNKLLFARQNSAASSVITKNDRVTPRKTDSPEETPMDVDQAGDESRDSPSNVILKIPSFKPVGPGSNTGKNGGEGFPGSGTPPLSYFSHSPHTDIPGGRPSDRVSPTSVKSMFMLKDVIAKSISQKFQQNLVSNHTNDLRHLNVSSPGMDTMEGLNPFKRNNLTSPGGGQGISVIKNLTTHDLTRSFGSSNSGLQNQQNNSSGGKGTRPKRGKYRNYDRDSLVEAVKAVQRGEMSVHRAGSYYGVPHSTLEYKVKERHLMRPRKREPKNPNPDDKLQAPSASKPSDIPGVGILRGEKPKMMQKPPTKPNFPATSPNGLKMPPLFDGNLGLGYNPPPFPFWPHSSAFPGLPVEFQQRNPGAPGNFPTNSESFYASQMMQKLQEESARHPALARKDSVGESSRDVIENSGENVTSANGSFVDSIIRSSLERQRPSGGEGDNEGPEGGRRRLLHDDLLLAEEMRQVARKLRARESSGPLGVPPQPSQAHPS